MRSTLIKGSYEVVYMLIAVTLFLPIGINNIAIIALIAIWIWEGDFSGKFRRLTNDKWALFFIGFYFIYAFGLLYTENSSSGFAQLERRLGFLIFPLIFATSSFVPGAKFIRNVLVVFALAILTTSFLFLTIAFFRYLTGGSSDVFYYNEFTSPLKLHPIYFGIYCLFSFVITVDYIINQYKGNRRLQAVSIAVSNLLLIALAILLSSKIVLGLVILYSVYIWLYKVEKVKAKGVYIGAILLFLIVLIYNASYTKERLQRIVGTEWNIIQADQFKYNENFNGLSIRLVFWKLSVQHLISDESLLFGVGTGDDKDFLNGVFAKHGLDSAGYLNYNPHNQFVSTLNKLGLLGLGYLILFLILLFRFARKHNYYILTSLILIVSIVCLTESFLSLNKGIIFFSFFYSFLAIYKKRNLAYKNVSSVRQDKVAIIGTAGIPANYGGFETLVEYLVRYLGEENRFIVYCSSNNYTERQSHYLNAELIYLPLNANGKTSILYDSLSIINSLDKARTLLVLGVGGAFLFPILRVFTSKKIIVNIDGLEWKRDKWGRVAKMYLKIQEYFAVKYSHRVIADNKGIQEYVAERYNKTPKLIAYGGSHAQKELPDSQNSALTPQRKYAFTVCRIEPENNIQMILKAFEKIDHLDLIIVGNWSSSEYGINAKNRYAHNSHFRLMEPIYDQKELNKLRSNCHIYIHGHSAGGTNPSLVEAMWLGLSIITFDVNYNRYTTENKAQYFDSSEELTKLIRTISEQEIKEISEYMKEIAKRRYTWKKITSQYQKLFN